MSFFDGKYKKYWSNLSGGILTPLKDDDKILANNLREVVR